ncbi:APC family permease [Paenibacillus jamilae]|uniref:APC family permease n=1 Tax=Paenibacillus jamilae TaxID=114136 RepID=UPI003D268EF5
MLLRLKRFLIGKPMKSQELGEEKLSKLKALAILSSDALSSVAYGTEQMLIVLFTVGFAAMWYSIPISIAVLALLAILVLSYRQTIFSYPSGGGAYIVAKDNLGIRTGLVAGGSLLIDYILTVAVSTSSATDAVTSAFPELQRYRIVIALVMIFFLTIMNLRGITESASVLAYPVYLFVVVIVLMIVIGLFRVATGDIQPIRADFGGQVSGVSLFLLLKAFSSGCSALTGVEAVSNAIPSFKAPAEKNAASTLALMGIILGFMFLGVSMLAYFYGISPIKDVTIMSQTAEAIFGRGIAYFVIQGATALILFLAANTAYAAFPLLAFMLTKDKFMPHAFMIRGDRLGFSNGIIILAVLAGGLAVVSNGYTENLIPLYALGVFIPFTISQLGMIRRWYRLKPQGWLIRLIINCIGMLTTLSITLIFLITKFNQVWMVFIFLPLVYMLFQKIHRHYMVVADQLRIDVESEKPEVKGNTIIIPVAGITRVVMNTISYAKSMSSDIVAVYIGFDDEDIEKMEKKWAEWDCGVRLIVLRSRYRSITRPLAKFIETVEWKKSGAGHITILIPQFITKHWWQNILHNQTSLLIRAYLFKNKNVTISTLPYHLNK